MSVLCNTVVRVGGSEIGVNLVFSWFFVGMGIALSMDAVLDIPLPSIDMTCLFASMVVNGSIVRDSSF